MQSNENKNLIILTAIAAFYYLLKEKDKSKKTQKLKLPDFLIVKDLTVEDLTVDHDAGFFSCFNVKLHKIVEFINEYKKFPKVVNGSRQFGLYKRSQDKALNKDITLDFFESYENKINVQKHINPKKFIDFKEWYQFKNYKTVFNFSVLSQLVDLYFTPSQKVINTRDFLQKKYNIDPSNCIGVYFRGTDKKSETKIASFDTFYNKIIEIREKNLDTKIFLQTDTAQFLDYLIHDKKMNRDDFIIIEENATSYSDAGIHNEKTGEDNYNEMFYLFATFLLLSKSQYFICSSGNCSLAMMFYRGHGENVYQFLNDKWMDK
jgi:hypothetical protein